MTNKEAKEKLYMEWQKFLEDNIDYAGVSEAYKMAFKALEQEPVLEKYKTEMEKTGIKLNEAIERYTSNAEFERTHGNLQGCLEFRQLAKWLRELKMYRYYLLKTEIEPQESEDKQ